MGAVGFINFLAVFIGNEENSLQHVFDVLMRFPKFFLLSPKSLVTGVRCDTFIGDLVGISN